MPDYLEREKVLDNSNIITVPTREYGSIEVVPVDYISNLPAVNKVFERGEWLTRTDVQPINRWIDAQKNPPPITDKESHASELVLILKENGSYDVCFYVYDEEGNYWETEDGRQMYDWGEVTYW